MIELPLAFFLNTHGVWLLFFFVIAYEFLVAKDYVVGLHALLAVCFTLVFSVVLKELFLAPRPFVLDGDLPKAGLSELSSLPSAHSAVSFALATAVTLHQKKLGVFLFTLAALISVGRVAANVHYPFDVILGMLIGVLTGVIFNQIHIKFKNERS